MFLWGQPKRYKIQISVKSGKHFSHLAGAVQTVHKMEQNARCQNVKFGLYYSCI